MEKSRQGKLKPLLDALQDLIRSGLTAADVIAAFHERGIRPLMERRLCIYEMVQGADLTGIKMPRAELARDVPRVRAKQAARAVPPTWFSRPMRPTPGYLSLVSVFSLVACVRRWSCRPVLMVS